MQNLLQQQQFCDTRNDGWIAETRLPLSTCVQYYVLDIEASCTQVANGV